MSAARYNTEYQSARTKYKKNPSRSDDSHNYTHTYIHTEIHTREKPKLIKML